MKARRFYIDKVLADETPIEAGDVLLAERVAYRVIDARPTESRIWANRWTVDVHPLGSYTSRNAVPPAPGRRWISIQNGGRRGMADL